MIAFSTKLKDHKSKSNQANLFFDDTTPFELQIKVDAFVSKLYKTSKSYHRKILIKIEPSSVDFYTYATSQN